MKNSGLTLLMAAILFSTTAKSQDTLRLFGNQKTRQHREQSGQTRYNTNGIQTLTGPGRNIGFYFGLNTGYSRIDGFDAFDAGASIALIANHGLAIGFAGKGFFTESWESAPGSDVSYNYAGGYGGLLIEPIILPRYPVHVAFPILIGAGGVARSTLTNFNHPYGYTDIYFGNADAYLIAEPGIQLELNVARWMRLALGGSYRFTSSLDPSEFESDLLNGFTGEISFKFGMF